MKILIVDDERFIRSSLKELLEMEKYTVDTAENGADAVKMAEAEKYDIIFCDIKMPGMDGVEVLSTLVADGVVRNGELIHPAGQSTSFCAAGLKEVWKKSTR